MTIQITTDHIERAKEAYDKGHLVCRCCPVSQGLLDLGFEPEVGVRQFRLFRDSRRIYWLPDEAAALVRKFDRGERVLPIEFTIEIDDQLARKAS